MYLGEWGTHTGQTFSSFQLSSVCLKDSSFNTSTDVLSKSKTELQDHSIKSYEHA